ncbi:hypothetical protein [Microbacterium aerolatum]|nr:hypothetical protein [Microbacterium aerolatum]
MKKMMPLGTELRPSSTSRSVRLFARCIALAASGAAGAMCLLLIDLGLVGIAPLEWPDLLTSTEMSDRGALSFLLGAFVAGVVVAMAAAALAPNVSSHAVWSIWCVAAGAASMAVPALQLNTAISLAVTPGKGTLTTLSIGIILPLVASLVFVWLAIDCYVAWRRCRRLKWANSGSA